MNPVYLIAPIAIVGALAYSVIMSRRMRARVASVGAEQVMTEQYGEHFRLQPGELLRQLWMGQLYVGPAIPEYHDTLGDKAGRVAKQAAVALVGGKLRYMAVQVYVALTTGGRLVVACSGREGKDDLSVSAHSEWQPGAPGVYFVPDLGIETGDAPSFDNGYRGPVGFVMFGHEPGTRLPVWLPADGCQAIAAWRGTPA
jgi:hypothetical protein